MDAPRHNSPIACHAALLIATLAAPAMGQASHDHTGPPDGPAPIRLQSSTRIVPADRAAPPRPQGQPLVPPPGPPVGRQVILQEDGGFRVGFDLDLLDDATLPSRFSPSTLPGDERLASVAVAPAVEDAVRDLQSPDWATREAAAGALLEDPFIDEQLLALLLPRPQGQQLDPEARHRLLTIVCDRLASLPRAALGIRMDQRDIGPGVLIDSLLDDMPAKQSGQLRPGDRILTIDGRPILRSSLASSIFQLERPGQRVRLGVIRPRQQAGAAVAPPAAPSETDIFEVELVLASSEQLERNDIAAWGGGRSAGIRMRAEQIREAVERFGPQVRDVAVARSPATDELPIEDHPELRELLLMRERIEAGEFVATPALRAAWQQTLDALRAQASDPTLPQASREFLTRVAQRYAEVMPR